MNTARRSLKVLAWSLVSTLSFACSEPFESEGAAGAAGSSGAGGTAGSAGSGGATGSAGTGGTAGSGGVFPTPDCGGEGWIIFHTEEKLASESKLILWGVCPSGSPLVRLFEDSTDDSYPSWHPDGGLILFVRRSANANYLMQLNVVTRSLSPVTSVAERTLKVPLYSPSGSNIGFLAERSVEESKLMQVTTVGDTPTRLTTLDDTVVEGEFSWVDDSKVVLRLGEGLNGRIHHYSLGELSSRQLTDMDASFPAHARHAPIVLFSHQPQGGNAPQLWQVNLANGNPVGAPDQFDPGTMPCWSPGGRVAFIKEQSIQVTDHVTPNPVTVQDLPNPVYLSPGCWQPDASSSSGK